MLPQRVIHRRLAQEHYQDRIIQHDPIEVEIPDLVQPAKYRFDTTIGQDWHGQSQRYRGKSSRNPTRMISSLDHVTEGGSRRDRLHRQNPR
jgi:hypothetical protein